MSKDLLSKRRFKIIFLLVADAVAAEATEEVVEVLEEEEASRMATVNKLSVAGQVYI